VAGDGGKHPEGPHLYRIGEYWYLLLAEGGTERGHAVTIARGPSPAGPFEPSPDNPLLTARGTDSTVQNTGHADLVQRPDGGWAMVYLGTRPRGSSPEWHVLGRETFAAEIVWLDGWPSIGAPILPARVATDLRVERLEGSSLPMSWVSPARFPGDVLRHRGGFWLLTATTKEPAAENLSFVGRRQEHLYATVTATVRVTDAVGGLSVRIDGRHHLDLEVDAGRVLAVAQIGEIRSVLGELAVEEGTDVILQLRMEPAQGSIFSTAVGPDRLVAGIVRDHGFVELGHLDGRYLSTELAGGFTGRMIGFYCRQGSLDIRRVDYLGADDPARLAPAAS
jgi:xylan 1,4-beta-xylosidase